MHITKVDSAYNNIFLFTNIYNRYKKFNTVPNLIKPKAQTDEKTPSKCQEIEPIVKAEILSAPVEALDKTAASICNNYWSGDIADRMTASMALSYILLRYPAIKHTANPSYQTKPSLTKKNLSIKTLINQGLV